MKKICSICGKEFEAKNNRIRHCPDKHILHCKLCGKEFEWKACCSNVYCSASCAQKDAGNKSRNKTLQEKYGVINSNQIPEAREKSKQTCLAKYGADNPSKNSEVKQKIVATFQKKYDVDNAMQVPEFSKACRDTFEFHYGTRGAYGSSELRAKIEATNIQRYGALHPMQNSEIRQKAEQTSFERYGTIHPSQSQSVKDRVSQTVQERFGVPWACMREEAREHKVISKPNLEFRDMLLAAGVECTLEFNIKNRSYDIKADNILIEIDPTFTHNSAESLFGDPLDLMYHYNKSRLAEENGYRCIHVFDWDDLNKIVNLIKPCTQIYARNCELRDVSIQDANMFTELYHVDGQCRGQVCNYGLYFDDELIEIMTFGKPRYNKNYDYELLRLCTKSGYKIIGGASKLFKAFIQKHPDKSIISYCNRAKFLGDVYDKLGMTLLRSVEPSKIWSKGTKKITQNLLNQRGYDQLFNTNYGKGTSNEQLMLDNGWLPVYDCGQSVYIYK